MGRGSCLRRIVGRIGLSMWVWTEEKNINMDMDMVVNASSEVGGGNFDSLYDKRGGLYYIYTCSV